MIYYNIFFFGIESLLKDFYRFIDEAEWPCMVQCILKRSVSFLGGFYLITIAAFFTTSAFADDQDTFNAVAGINWQHDDNLFRAPSGANLSPAHRSDQIESGFVGIRIDKLYALQHFRVNFTHSAYRYQNNSSLKFDTNEYRFDADWSPHDNWHMLAGIANYRLKNSQVLNEQSG